MEHIYDIAMVHFSTLKIIEAPWPYIYIWFNLNSVWCFFEFEANPYSFFFILLFHFRWISATRVSSSNHTHQKTKWGLTYFFFMESFPSPTFIERKFIIFVCFFLFAFLFYVFWPKNIVCSFFSFVYDRKNGRVKFSLLLSCNLHHLMQHFSVEIWCTCSL